jgi:hypothetical protein
MLPSFRLIVAAFLCGFCVVFAGLRFAATLHSAHEMLPLIAAQAAPMPAGANGPSAIKPVRYDLRFVARAQALEPMFANLAIEPAERAVPAIPAAAIDVRAGTPVEVPASAADMRGREPAGAPDRPDGSQEAPSVSPHRHDVGTDEEADAVATVPSAFVAAPAHPASPEDPVVPADLKEQGSGPAKLAAAPASPAHVAAEEPPADRSPTGSVAASTEPAEAPQTRNPEAEPVAPTTAAIPAAKPKAAAQAPRGGTVRNKKRTRTARRTADPFDNGSRDPFAGAFGRPFNNN